MIRFYKSPQPVTLFSIPLIILILWAQAMPSMAPVVTTDSMLLWKTVAGWFNGWPNWLNFLLMVSLVSFNAIYLNLVCNKHEVLYKASYLPAFVFALFISCRPEFLVFHPIHFVNLIFIRVFDKSFSLLKSSQNTVGPPRYIGAKPWWIFIGPRRGIAKTSSPMIFVP